VVPLLLESMAALNKERPANAIAWLANYLEEHNPENNQPEAGEGYDDDYENDRPE
jgi:hypothetical protein